METKQVAIANAAAPALAEGAQTVLSVDLAGNLRTSGGGGGGGPVTIADGSDVVAGSTTDVAVTTDANGTLSAKLRGIIVILLRMFQLATPIRNQQVGINTSEIVDSVGNGVTVTGNRLDVNATVNFPTDQNINVDKFGGTTVTIGQQLNAASIPVVLPLTQISTLTPPTTVTVQQATAANLNATVSGTVTTAPPSHASTNVDELGGQVIALNAGVATPGTERVVQATAAVLNVTQVSVLVTNTTVIAANVNRIKVRIINTSANPVWIGPTNPATTANGAYIPGIPGYPWSTRYEGALYAISTGGTALVTVDEESAS